MKRFILLLTLSLLPISHASAGEFIVPDGKLIWQNVYEANVTLEELETIIVNSGRFFDVINTGDRVTFRCERAHLDPQEFGYSWGTTPIYVTGNDVSFFCTVQVKDGRYRVTAEQFVLTNNRTGGLLVEGATEKIETYAVDRSGKLKASFLKKPATIYDLFLTKLLTLTDKDYLVDEW